MSKAKAKSAKVTNTPLKGRLNDGTAEFKTIARRRLAQLDLAQDIIKRRKKLGLSQTELARRAGITQALVSRIETGNFKNCEINTLVRIAAALEARYDFRLVADSQEPEESDPLAPFSQPPAKAAAG